MGNLYQKFGEFNSAAEINRAAAAQLAEGDHDAIRELAKENGIDETDVQDYIDGLVPELCTPQMAALGKLDAEVANLYDLPMTMQGWVDHIKTMVMDNPVFALGVREKGKSLVKLFAKLIMEISKHRKTVPIDIVREARKLGGSLPDNLPVGDLSKKEFRDIVEAFYTPEPPQTDEPYPFDNVTTEAAGGENDEVAPVQQDEPKAVADEEAGEDT